MALPPFPPLETERFLLRRLVASDASDRYAGWFEDPIAKAYIRAARAPHSIEDLRSYIAARNADPATCFLGIFAKAGGHIGNLKFEPVNTDRQFAVMGVLIGEPPWRGRGVIGEVLTATFPWLRAAGIRRVLLGVERSNEPAIRAYAKIGFVEEACPEMKLDPESGQAMVLRI